MNIFPERISKEELLNLPLKSFEGDIKTICTQAEFQEVLTELLNEKIFGFDTETRPAFKKGISYKVALLQLSCKDTVYLFRLNKLGMPDDLAKILANKDVIKVGAAIRDDIKGLQFHHKFTQAGFVELQTYVRKYGIHDASLAKITASVLDFRISKSQRLSNWETENLSVAQQKYAATDAWVGFQIYNKLTHNCKPIC